MASPVCIGLVFSFLSIISTISLSVSVNHHHEQYLDTTSPLLSDFERKHRIFGNLLVDRETDPLLYPNVVRTTATSICERKRKKSIFVYGRCPETCSLFSLDLFYSCAGMIQFGCQLVPCPVNPGTYSCSLNPEAPKARTICPGDKVVFDSVKLEKLNTVTYSIDLQANPKKTDIYFLADATGSMNKAIRTARKRAWALLDLFRLRPSVAFGIGQFRDERELDNGFENLLSITGNRVNATAAIRKWKAQGGRDRDEANLVALYRIATEKTIGWRERSRKIVVYFGDWPGHEPTCWDGKQITRETVIEKLNDKNISVIAVNFKQLDAAPMPFRCNMTRFRGFAKAGQASQISEATNGNVISSRTQTRLIELIRIAVRSLPKTFDVDTSECEADIESTHNPPLPLEVAAWESTTVTNTMKLKPNVCESKGKFKCNLKYTEGGAEMKDTEIEMVNVRGCPNA